MLRHLAALLLLATSAVAAPVPQPRPSPPFPYGVHRVEDQGTLTLTRHGTFARCYPWGIEYVGTFSPASALTARITSITYVWEDGCCVDPADYSLAYSLRFDPVGRCWRLDGRRLTPSD